MSRFQGNFVWHELMTNDPQTATAFYKHVVGWEAADMNLPDRTYIRLSIGKTGVGGLMALPQEARAAGAKPGWTGYIGVDDVDAAAAGVERGGGTVHRAPADIPTVGRFAIVSDPQGASFVLFKGAGGAAPERPAPGTPGLTGWNELHADDWESAFAFYAGLFGWQKAEAVDMGPMGTYQLFSAGAEPLGGMMTDRRPDTRPSWLYYFNVDAVDAAAKRVTAKGGQVTQGPVEVPGGSWIVHGLDPEGVKFALSGPRR